MAAPAEQKAIIAIASYLALEFTRDENHDTMCDLLVSALTACRSHLPVLEPVILACDRYLAQKDAASQLYLRQVLRRYHMAAAGSLMAEVVRRR